MRWVFDTTRRFKRRPHYDLVEIDDDCEKLVSTFLSEQRGQVRYPITTDELQVLIERHVDYLDMFADLSDEGPGVQGVTYFQPRARPIVKVSRDLGADEVRANRLRTTLTHELGHVRFHSFLWATEAESLPLFGDDAGPHQGPRCHRDDMVRPRERTDWMEWQAGYASGSFLMPRNALRAFIGAAPTVPLQPTTTQAVALVASVKEQFGVSADAARVRISQLGYLARQDTLLPT